MGTWPLSAGWREIEFGVEIEWVGAPQGAVQLLPGWEIVAEDLLFFDDGRMVDPVTGDDVMGGELVSPRLTWEEREQIAAMCARLKALGAAGNWSCGLHVHADGSRWGQALLLPGLDAARATEAALRRVLDTAPHRLDYAPPTTAALREAVARLPAPAGPDAVLQRLVYGQRPQEHRGGINFRSLFEKGSVELRLPNASLEPEAIYRTIELWLRWVAAVGEGRELSASPADLIRSLGAPAEGYPPRQDAPAWWWRRRAMDRALYPVLLPLCREWVQELYPQVNVPCDIVWIDGTAGDRVVALAEAGDVKVYLVFGTGAGGWKRIEATTAWRPDLASGRPSPGDIPLSAAAGWSPGEKRPFP